MLFKQISFVAVTVCVWHEICHFNHFKCTVPGIRVLAQCGTPVTALFPKLFITPVETLQTLSSNSPFSAPLGPGNLNLLSVSMNWTTSVQFSSVQSLSRV